MANKKHLDIVSMNCHGYKGNGHYTNSIIQQNDIIFLCEHWLSSAESFLLSDQSSSHELIFSPAQKQHTGRPYGGNCFLYKNDIVKKVDIIHEDEHILAIKSNIGSETVVLIGIYLTAYHDNTSIEKYTFELNTLTSIINQFIEEAEIIMFGDFQSFPSNTYDLCNRVSTVRNPLSMKLSNFLSENCLQFLDVTKGSGPTYTYHHSTLNHSSYIDHVALLEHSKYINNSSCGVVHPELTNTGDHLPVKITIQINNDTQDHNSAIKTNKSIPRRLWKNNRFIQLYQEEINNAFSEKTFDAEQIDKEIDWLHKTILSCSQVAFNTLNKRYFQLTPKNWWSEDLSKSKRNLSHFYNMWKNANFPREETSEVYSRYKLARRIFRKDVKLAQHNLISNRYTKIESLKKIHPQKFWQKLRSLKSSSNTRLFTISDKTTKETISTEFGKHFKHLLNTPRIDAHTNDEKFVRSDSNVEVLITRDELLNALQLLNRGKSLDQFNISSEHFIHIKNDAFFKYLTELYNEIFRSGETPQQLSSSIIIPLVKSFKKSLSNPNNYRGVSLIPIMTKILELIILQKCPILTDCHESQFGFKPNSSTIHAEFILKETIRHYNNRGSPLYICSLDAEKAFDSCNWDKLFNKLSHEKILPTPITNVLHSLYTSGTANVLYRGMKSSSFTLTQGVRQGSILSPYLYNIYTEAMLEEIRKGIVGTVCFEVFTGIIAYADDIILISATLTGLQKMINDCVKYGYKHKIKFNSNKTEFLHSGETYNNKNLYVDNVQVSMKETFTHLGFNWKRSNTIKTIDIQKSHLQSRMNEFWAATNALISGGIRFLHPHTIITLFETMLIPKLLYGLELCELTKPLLTELDKNARIALKYIFNVSKYSFNILHEVFSLNKVSQILQHRKLKTLIRLLQNASTRKIIIGQSCSELHPSSFVSDAVRVSKLCEIDFKQLLFSRQVPKLKKNVATDENLDRINSLRPLIDEWSILENRLIFKRLIEENVVQAI